MQNFEFLRESGMLERVQSLFMMKSLFIKIFCVYKNLDGCTSWRLSEMESDTLLKHVVSCNF